MCLFFFLLFLFFTVPQPAVFGARADIVLRAVMWM